MLGLDEHRGLFELSNDDGVQRGVRTLAAFVHEIATDVFPLNDALLERLAEERRRRTHEYNLGFDRRAAERAFKRADYPEAVRLFEQIGPDDLTPLETKRLSRARRLASGR